MHKGAMKDERGLVSIMVSMIMMLVISLIVLAFAQATRNNSREALDRQLSTAAYYAAESGVNDVVSYLVTDPTYSSDTDDQNTCNNFTENVANTNNVLDPSTNTQYTCVLVNTHPDSLVANNVSLGGNTIWKISDSNGNNINSLTFTFGTNSATAASNTGNCTESAGTYKPASPSASRCDFGVLRLDLVNSNGEDLAGKTADDLAALTKTVFIQPSTSASTPAPVNFASGTSGYAYTCQIAASACSIKLDVTSGATDTYIARLTMLYLGSDSISVKGTSGTLPVDDPMLFTGGQAVIDSTGRSVDELRRLQVRVSLTPSGATVPANALESRQTICKHFQVSTTNPTPADTCL